SGGIIFAMVVNFLMSTVVNILIDIHKDIREVFWTRMGKIENWRSSVPFIVFGKLQISESGKPFIFVRNSFEMYIDKREYNKNKVKYG
ncbi:hypothetical protein, partial [Brevibacillus formosus]|uniref:hypothetical protein n=1 Tax=Brevibacillus formosus TaxID=54913 RepID=UPI003F1C7C68